MAGGWVAGWMSHAACINTAGSGSGSVSANILQRMSRHTTFFGGYHVALAQR